MAPVEKLKESENTGMYYQEIKMLLAGYNINFTSIARLGKPISRIKDVIQFAKKNNKGEGWIVGAIRDDYKLEIHSSNSKILKDYGKQEPVIDQDTEDIYKSLGI